MNKILRIVAVAMVLTFLAVGMAMALRGCPSSGVADLKTREATAFELADIARPQPARPQPAPTPEEEEFAGETNALKPQTLAMGEVKLVVELRLPANFKLNGEAPSAVEIALQGALTLADGAAGKIIAKPTFPLEVTLQASPGQGAAQATLVLYYCEAGKDSSCYFKEMRITAPVEVGELGPRELRLSYSIPRL